MYSDSSGIPHKTVSSIKFTSFSKDETRNLSVKRAYNPHCFDSLDCAVDGGLYDVAYGSYNFNSLCSTCHESSSSCTGHLGHIELPLPIYNPVFFKQVLALLQSTCSNCKRFTANKEETLLLATQLDMLMNDDLNNLLMLEDSKSAVFDNIESAEHEGSKSHFFISKLKKARKSTKKKECEYFSNNWTRHTVQLHRKIFQEFTSLLSRPSSNKNICPHCKKKYDRFGEENKCRIYIKEGVKRRYVTPFYVRDHLNAVWKNEHNILSKVFKLVNDNAQSNSSEMSLSNGLDAFFLETLLLPSTKFRPPRFGFEDPQTTLYSKILMDCKILSVLMKKLNGEKKTNAHANDLSSDRTEKLNKDVINTIPGNTFSEKLGNAWHRLQQHVNTVFDSDQKFNKLFKGNQAAAGIRQLLEKKEGLFRKFMMGKRVNFAARSVISPDPYIATNEIGVPLVFASKLTYPTPVTSWNIKKLRQAVINGPLGYPGATHVVINGRKIMLLDNNKSQRIAVAKQLFTSDGDKQTSNCNLQEPNTVLRYLETGDVLLLNRQPTLHRGSIMAHKARVLPGEKTLRLHYANCKSYNADFDGDEMNAHYPQSELGRAEAMGLMLTDMQYLSAKDGKPLSCLIQDHIVAGVQMCIRGRFFNQDEYHSLIYSALMMLPFKINLLPPSILKPQRLWSGKQILSSLILNIIPSGKPFFNLKSKSKISATDWSNEAVTHSRIGLSLGEMCESEVVIRNGQLLCGILDKAHYGASDFGLVHTLYELYGGDTSGKMLTCLARLFTTFLQLYKGFTLGVVDILTTPEGDLERREIIKKSQNIEFSQVTESFGIDLKNSKELTKTLEEAHAALYLDPKNGKNLTASIDHSMKKISNSINNEISHSCSGKGLFKSFPANNLQLMVKSGAKGGLVNCLQISCSLGQIELEGCRPQLTMAGRTFPSFKPFDGSLRAGGFVSQRFLTGLRPQEYYFHCMAGREGLVDTAIKTSNSGYLQRCLVKSLESLLLSYDLTVRDCSGAIVQFLYGEDGIDVGKSPFLKSKQFDFLVDNLQVLSSELPTSQNANQYFDDTMSKQKWKKYTKSKKKFRKKLQAHPDMQKFQISGFNCFEKTLKNKYSKAEVLEKWVDLTHEQQLKFHKKAKRIMVDPVISQLRPDLHLGSVSEQYHNNVRNYLSSHSTRTDPRLKPIFDWRYQRSLCEPGEGVGLLAAQSVGEPSTQMTLNTFHFAGRGDMNVTLGIPRLREILMWNVKCPKTPNVTAPVLHGKLKEAEDLCRKFSTVLLSEVLQKFTLEECLVVEGPTCVRKCILTVFIQPKKHTSLKFGLNHDQIVKHIEMKFLPSLLSLINTRLKKVGSCELVYDKSQADGVNKDDDEIVDEVEANDEDTMINDDQDGQFVDEDRDATTAMQKEKKNDEIEYDDEEDAEEEHTKTNQSQINSFIDDESCVEGMKRNVGTSVDGRVCCKDNTYNEATQQYQVALHLPLGNFNINLLSLVRTCLQSSRIRETTAINRCMLVDGKKSSTGDTSTKFMVDGLNFDVFSENQHCLDANKLYSNCVHSMYERYGIEAARNVIEQEVINVFGVYGIAIDRRHLSLLADNMCTEGVPQGCNRSAMKTCSSPLQQITFETSLNFLSDATLHGYVDRMGSPSASVVTGSLVKAGTGSFSLIYPMVS